MRTYDEIINTRQNEIFNEVQEIDQEILLLTARLDSLKAKKEQRIAEHQMLQSIQERGLAVSPSGRISRVHIEDAVKRIFDKTGRPMAVRELLRQLEEFGYQWSNYQTAYQHVIRDLDILESVGMRGYYQIVRG